MGANDLDSYVQAFQNDGIPFMTLKWTWENNQYYSLLANPCGFILIELMSNHLSSVPEEDMIQSHTRMTWRKYNTNIIPGHHITPIRVSRAISRPELVDLFWIDILNSEEIYSQTFDDGTTVREIIPPGSTVHIQFWSGHPTSDEFTVADFEDYINSVHNDVMINGLIIILLLMHSLVQLLLSWHKFLKPTTSAITGGKFPVEFTRFMWLTKVDMAFNLIFQEGILYHPMYQPIQLPVLLMMDA